MKRLNPLLILVTLLIATNVNAHDDELNYNQISLEASASADVENDTMIVSLYAQEEGSKAATLSDNVNKKINNALAILKQHKSINVETESYSTTPVYNKNQIISWRVKQSIRLESKDMPLMSELIGELQQQLKLNQISFDVSREKSEQETQLLIDQALAAYDKRATQISNTLKSGIYKIVNMNVSTSTSAQPYRYKQSRAMMADSMSVAVPEIAKGNKTLTVRVNGTIEIKK
jgi:predicted secreted protein